VPLKPKVLETLVVLVENTGRALDKEELMKRLWPEVVVEEANLAVNISQLRKVLGDGENGEGYIETVPKRGYRFNAQVTKVLADPVDMIVRERTRARIVIDEHETAPDRMAHLAWDTAVLPARTGPALATSSIISRRRNRTLAAGICVAVVAAL